MKNYKYLVDNADMYDGDVDEYLNDEDYMKKSKRPVKMKDEFSKKKSKKFNKHKHKEKDISD